MGETRKPSWSELRVHEEACGPELHLLSSSSRMSNREHVDLEVSKQAVDKVQRTFYPLAGTQPKLPSEAIPLPAIA